MRDHAGELAVDLAGRGERRGDGLVVGRGQSVAVVAVGLEILALGIETVAHADAHRRHGARMHGALGTDLRPSELLQVGLALLVLGFHRAAEERGRYLAEAVDVRLQAGRLRLLGRDFAVEVPQDQPEPALEARRLRLGFVGIDRLAPPFRAGDADALAGVLAHGVLIELGASLHDTVEGQVALGLLDGVVGPILDAFGLVLLGLADARRHAVAAVVRGLGDGLERGGVAALARDVDLAHLGGALRLLPELV